MPLRSTSEMGWPLPPSTCREGEVLCGAGPVTPSCGTCSVVWKEPDWTASRRVAGVVLTTICPLLCETEPTLRKKPRGLFGEARPAGARSPTRTLPAESERMFACVAAGNSSCPGCTTTSAASALETTVTPLASVTSLVPGDGCEPHATAARTPASETPLRIVRPLTARLR